MTSLALLHTVPDCSEYSNWKLVRHALDEWAVVDKFTRVPRGRPRKKRQDKASFRALRGVGAMDMLAGGADVAERHSVHCSTCGETGHYATTCRIPHNWSCFINAVEVNKHQNTRALIGWRGGCGHGAPGKLGVCLNLFLEGIYDSLIFQTRIYGSFSLLYI